MSRTTSSIVIVVICLLLADQSIKHSDYKSCMLNALTHSITFAASSVEDQSVVTGIIGGWCGSPLMATRYHLRAEPMMTMTSPTIRQAVMPVFK